jgi:hypothetical protein
MTAVYLALTLMTLVGSRRRLGKAFRHWRR